MNDMIKKDIVLDAFDKVIKYIHDAEGGVYREEYNMFYDALGYDFKKQNDCKHVFKVGISRCIMCGHKNIVQEEYDRVNKKVGSLPEPTTERPEFSVPEGGVIDYTEDNKESTYTDKPISCSGKINKRLEKREEIDFLFRDLYHFFKMSEDHPAPLTLALNKEASKVFNIPEEKVTQKHINFRIYNDVIRQKLEEIKENVKKEIVKQPTPRNYTL
jgi:hypothetical protein